MRVRHFREESKIDLEDLDDLWYLKSVLEKGDEVSGVGYRRLRDDTKTRADKGQRVRVFLTLKHEASELHKHSKTLRVTGEIIKSSDESIAHGSYHTLDIAVHDSVRIRKNWKRWQLERLKEAEESSKVGVVLIVSIEEGEADFAVLRRYGIDYAFRLTTTIQGKEMEDQYEVSAGNFYSAAAKKIIAMKKQEDLSAVVLCGPGFAKEKVHELIQAEGVEGVFLQAAGCGGRAGIQEILKRGVVETLVDESRIAVETRLVEELFTSIAKDRLSAYGKAEVESASDLGAVKTLLITYPFLQKHNPDRLLENVKRQRGEITVVSPEHDAGERLEAIGGIGALLRFPVR